MSKNYKYFFNPLAMSFGIIWQGATPKPPERGLEHHPFLNKINSSVGATCL